MKSSKKPSKEPSLPSQDESRRANVLREEMLSQFRMFGDSLSIIREDVSGIKPRLDKLSDKVDLLESAVRTHTEAIHALRADVTTLKSDVAEIKGDIKGYNQRLEVVEAKVAS